MRECKEALKLAVAERQKYISRVKVGNIICSVANP
jgi:hypothetical protein